MVRVFLQFLLLHSMNTLFWSKRNSYALTYVTVLYGLDLQISTLSYLLRNRGHFRGSSLHLKHPAIRRGKCILSLIKYLVSWVGETILGMVSFEFRHFEQFGLGTKFLYI